MENSETGNKKKGSLHIHNILVYDIWNKEFLKSSLKQKQLWLQMQRKPIKSSIGKDSLYLTNLESDYINNNSTRAKYITYHLSYLVVDMCGPKERQMALQKIQWAQVVRSNAILPKAHCLLTSPLEWQLTDVETYA